MKNADIKLPESAEDYLHVFRRRLPLQIKLHELLKAVGVSTEGCVCLDIGAESGLISYYLRKNGGKWHTLALDEDSENSARASGLDSVHEAKEKGLPFKNKCFDLVIVAGGLEGIESDAAFIEECHRILQPEGRLVVTVPYCKQWTMIRSIRGLLGMNYEKRRLAREGYTESQLFDILKDGFDLSSMRTYSRFFVEFVDTIVTYLARKMSSGAEHDVRKLKKMYSVASVFYRVAFQADLLLFFNRGFNLIAVAKRRGWRSRKAPVLVDGRSISEVVLSRLAR